VPASMLHALPSDLREAFKNDRTTGFWTELGSGSGGVGFRVINNTADCLGPALILFSGPTPENDWPSLPAQWVDDGMVTLKCAKGTLVPVGTLAIPGRGTWKRPRLESDAASSHSADDRGMASEHSLATAQRMAIVTTLDDDYEARLANAYDDLVRLITAGLEQMGPAAGRDESRIESLRRQLEQTRHVASEVRQWTQTTSPSPLSTDVERSRLEADVAAATAQPLAADVHMEQTVPRAAAPKSASRPFSPLDTGECWCSSSGLSEGSERSIRRSSTDQAMQRSPGLSFQLQKQGRSDTLLVHPPSRLKMMVRSVRAMFGWPTE